jgi:hypothetical protein
MSSPKSGHFGHVLRRSATSVLCSLSLIGGATALPANAADPIRGSVQLDQPIVLAGGKTVVYAVVSF